jgi:PAS domain S-box-containing protein
MPATPVPPADESVDILLVDDRKEDLLALSGVLERPDYQISTASSGADALKAILQREFAVVLLDVMMPTMDGFELATLIKQRERSRHTPLIFLTAAGSDIQRIYQGYSVGAVDYLPKPVEPDVVRSKVAIFADLFRKNRQIARQALALREAERRERELQIAELRLMAERRYVNLAEAIPQIVWTADAGGEIRYANRRWVEYTGIETQRIRSGGWTKAIHPEDLENTVEAWEVAVRNGDVYEVECRLRRASDGEFRWHVFRAVPEHADDGSIIGWLGTATDFQELKLAIRARDEFLSIASHELRTPLTALKLRVQGLLQGKSLDDKLRKRLESASRQTERLERLIDNLLDVSRITTGHLELEPEEIDLVEVVGDVVERHRDEATQNGSRIEIESIAQASGLWDRMRVEQVVTNLISNAVKYGDGKPISVTIRADNEFAEVSVKDNGIGIAAADLERIFAQFERAATRRTYGGLGMGLYIARQIVTAHGGSVRVESELGQGSTFSVSLPRSRLQKEA